MKVQCKFCNNAVMGMHFNKVWYQLYLTEHLSILNRIVDPREVQFMQVSLNLWIFTPLSTAELSIFFKCTMYFTIYRRYFLLRFEQFSWISYLNNSLKSRGTKDKFRWVKVSGTTPYWNAFPWLHYCRIYIEQVKYMVHLKNIESSAVERGVKIHKYNETCINWTSLGSTILLRIDRCSVKYRLN
jgi:hypothetical protein